MKGLDNNWLTSGLIDFEYKKYALLAYLQEVEAHFKQVKLYPSLSDMIAHYQNLVQVRDQKQQIAEHFPKEISRKGLENWQLAYNKLVADDELMAELESIIAFAIPELGKHIAEGRDIYQYVEENLRINPVGITPLNTECGYLLVSTSTSAETQVYEYQITIFENVSEKYRGISLQYIESARRSLAHTFEQMKIDLVRRHKKLPNPATFLIESKINCPWHETLLPVAKRSFVRYIATGRE